MQKKFKKLQKKTYVGFNSNSVVPIKKQNQHPRNQFSSKLICFAEKVDIKGAWLFNQQMDYLGSVEEIQLMRDAAALVEKTASTLNSAIDYGSSDEDLEPFQQSYEFAINQAKTAAALAIFGSTFLKDLDVIDLADVFDGMQPRRFRGGQSAASSGQVKPAENADDHPEISLGEHEGKAYWDRLNVRQKNNIAKIMQKRKTGVQLGIAEIEYFKRLGEPIRNFVLFNPFFINTYDLGFFNVGDVFEIKISLKNLSVKVLESVMLTSNNNNSSSFMPVPKASGASVRANFYRQSITFHFTVLKSKNSWSDSEGLYFIGAELYNKLLSEMLNTTILMESISLKRKIPSLNGSTKRTVAFGKRGKRNPQTDGVSPRPFVFNLSSIELPGDSDAYRLSIPFVSPVFENLDIQGNNGLDNEGLIIKYCSFLNGNISIPPLNGSKPDDLLILKLTVKSQKQAELAQYAHCSFVSPVGFFGNFSASAKLLPEVVLTNSENESSNNQNSSVEAKSISKKVKKLESDITTIEDSLADLREKSETANEPELSKIQIKLDRLKNIKVEKLIQIDDLVRSNSEDSSMDGEGENLDED
jgi:hypothetical protein